MHAEQSVLVLVDYQARLMPAIYDSNRVTVNATLLAKAARVLSIPVFGTEQNPSGLGPNMEQIGSECTRTITKMHFDACKDGLLDALNGESAGRNQVVIAGCEAHVCMLQTALGLLRSGKQVWVVTSASGSRRKDDHATAMTRLAQAGASIVTHEMALFEWLDDCENPGFREVLKLIKKVG